MVTGSPAWKPHATFALVTSWNMAASSPIFQEPNDSPRSALRSKSVAFQRRGVLGRRGSCELSGDGVRHGSKRLLGIGHHRTAHHEVTGSAHHRADPERQCPAEQGGSLPFEEVLEEGLLDPAPDA